MNYSRFGASCELESAQAAAHLRGHTETAVWRLCLSQKKVDLRTFRRQCVIIDERAIYIYIYIHLYVHTVRIDNVPKLCAELLYILQSIMEKIRWARILGMCCIL